MDWVEGVRLWLSLGEGSVDESKDSADRIRRRFDVEPSTIWVVLAFFAIVGGLVREWKTVLIGL